MSDEWGQRSEYYDDGIRFGTGPEMIAKIKAKDSRIAEQAERIAGYEAALTAVIQSTRSYLPPDGISAKECISRVLAAVDNPQMYQLLVAKADATKDARISVLEQTVSKAFLRVQELEAALGEAGEALEPLAHFQELLPENDYEEFGIEVLSGDLRKAKAVRERIMDLCHADPVPGCETSSAAPHQSDEGEAR